MIPKRFVIAVIGMLSTVALAFMGMINGRLALVVIVGVLIAFGAFEKLSS